MELSEARGEFKWTDGSAVTYTHFGTDSGECHEIKILLKDKVLSVFLNLIQVSDKVVIVIIIIINKGQQCNAGRE